MPSFEPSRAAVIALLALVPVVVFAVARGTPVVALSAVCVVLIAASVFYMFDGGRRPGESTPR